MRVNFPISITAADNKERTISGKIVTWNEKGNTSLGPTVFAADSIEMKSVKLLLEHDRTRPIGKMLSHTQTKDGIEAVFKVANTMAGEDALVEASEGLRDGFSVGAQVDEWSNENGVMKILKARLDEVSLVTDPAIDSARVSEVAASENEAPENSDSATAEADQPTEGEQVSDTTVPAPAVEETVEAAKVETVSAARPAFYTAPRIELSKEKYLEASVRAKVLGDESSIQYLRAAADTTDNAGLVPTRQLTEIINPLSNADRPSIDAISRGTLPDAGLTFEIPKISQVPTVAQTNEGSAPSETDQNVGYLSVDVKKYAGQQTFSVEILDRSSPAFFAELVRQMEFAYAKATNAAVSAALVTGATDGGNRTLSAPNLQDFVADASVSIYKGTLGFAQNLIVSPEQWGAIMGLVDGSDRPLFTAIAPQNAPGTLAPGAVRGNVSGLALYVDRSLTTGSGLGDGTMIVVNPEAYTWYESSRFRLETNVIASGQVSVAYYGYGAIATKVAAGAYKWMVA
jgi:HK97 family phage major capsid protein